MQSLNSVGAVGGGVLSARVWFTDLGTNFGHFLVIKHKQGYVWANFMTKGSLKRYVYPATSPNSKIKIFNSCQRAKWPKISFLALEPKRRTLAQIWDHTPDRSHQGAHFFVFWSFLYLEVFGDQGSERDFQNCRNGPAADKKGPVGPPWMDFFPIFFYPGLIFI